MNRDPKRPAPRRCACGAEITEKRRRHCIACRGTAIARRRQLPPLNVVPIRPVVDEDVVSVLDRLLTRAKSGDIRFIALVYEMQNGSVGTTWKGWRRDRFATVGHIDHLKYRMNKDIDDSPSEPPIPPAS